MSRFLWFTVYNATELLTARYSTTGTIMPQNRIYSQERICFCSSNDSARKASRKNHTQFMNHRKGSKAKPPTNNQHYLSRLSLTDIT